MQCAEEVPQDLRYHEQEAHWRSLDLLGSSRGAWEVFSQEAPGAYKEPSAVPWSGSQGLFK
jgi:hypothetical protein